MRVAFVTSHPIQYQVPVFRCLANRADMDFVVLFGMIPDAAAQGSGFGVRFEWDIPLLDGYQSVVLNNVAKQPSVTHFGGCDTPGIEAELQRLQIDVVVVNGWVVKTCVQTLKACRRLGIPCIVRGEANDLRPRAWWKKLLQRVLVRRYDAVLAIGQANRSFYLSRGVQAARIFHAKYCVENSRFMAASAVSEIRRGELRAKWSVAENVVCLLYCGKVETKKHPLELLQAVSRACTAGARLHLLMVGDGPLRPACEALIRDQSLPVTITGFLNQSEIVDAYVAADVLALPSDAGETWGLVVNEAMACGRPALVSDQVGCAADLIEEDKTGWVFPFGDWRRLAELLAVISESPERVRSMGDACRQKIRGYSPEAAAEGIAEAVHIVCSGRK